MEWSDNEDDDTDDDDETDDAEANIMTKLMMPMFKIISTAIVTFTDHLSVKFKGFVKLTAGYKRLREH